MISFEVGKSYHVWPCYTYTVTKRTDAFVTFKSGTKTIRRKPYNHADGYEWVAIPYNQRIDARDVTTDAKIQATLESCMKETEARDVSETWSKADRRKVNEFFRKLNNEQITVALNYYREAMKFAETYDFSHLQDVTAADKVEAWLREGQTERWVDCIDEMARKLNVKPNHSRYFCSFEDFESESEVVDKLTAKISLIGRDPRALAAEKAYEQELADKRHEAEALASQYVLFSNGELVSLPIKDMQKIQKEHGSNTLEIITKVIAEHNCRVLSECATREELIAKLKSTNEWAVSVVASHMCGKQFRGYDCTPNDKYASRFADWFMSTEYGTKISIQSEPVQKSNVISSYAIGKRIVSLKGNAKAQQALLKDCGDEFLLGMFTVFDAPVRVSMDTPDELRKYMCRDVLKAIRTPSYAKFVLAGVNAELKKNTVVNKSYLDGWKKFLEGICA